MRRKAVQHNGIGVSTVEQRGVDLERAKRADPVEAVVLLPHRRPRVGDQHVGAAGGGLRVGGDGHRRPGLGGPTLGGGEEPRLRPETGWRGDGHVHAGGHAADHQRVRHIVGAVTEVGHPQAAERPLAFGQGLQVGKHLAGMEVVGQRIDDGNRCRGGHRGEPVLAEGAPHDRVDETRQHPAGVLQRFVAAELGGPAVDDDGVPAELGDAHLEGEPGASGVLVEDHRHPARPFERPPAQRVLLQLGRQREHLGLFGRRQVVVAQEVPQGAHAFPISTASSRTAGSAVRKLSI